MKPIICAVCAPSLCTTFTASCYQPNHPRAHHTHTRVDGFVSLSISRQMNKRYVVMSKVQCLEAAVAADTKVLKAAAAAQGPSSTADHPFEGKAYVQVSYIRV